MRLAACLAAALLAAGPALAQDDAEDAPAETAAERDCFNARSINGFGVIDSDTLRLSVGASRDYEVDVYRAGCFSLRWADQIAVVAEGSNWICVGDRPAQGRIVTDEGDRCRIREVRRILPEADVEDDAELGAQSDDGAGAAGPDAR